MANPPSKSFVSKQNKDKQNRLILKAIIQHKRPLTRRFLIEATGIKPATLRRILYNFINKSKLLKVVYSKQCERTGRKVFHYYFNEISFVSSLNDNPVNTKP